MTSFQLQWDILESDANKIIKDFMKEKAISRAALADIKYKGGSILVNGVEQTVRYSLKKGDLLKVSFPVEHPSVGIKGEAIPLDLVYEDEYVLIVNKQAGMSTIPSREHPSGSLANALIGYYEQKAIRATAHIVTRLDRDTSGLVLIAKHRHVHHLLSEEQKAGRVKRIYQAFVEGALENHSGIIEKPIARNPNSIIERMVDPNGQYACTHYEVLCYKRSFTHVKLKLGTGRTHQIRVHMSYIGHPLVGDQLYDGNDTLLKRQALHCYELKFFHPFLEENMTFKSELPKDMGSLM
ncbi:23S rRNA pseudouridine1911/1915/1917 synthase [Cytobacillus eiseniae]|uniref:Pseudouridine synthase n=1 Tax=Cytobacillus eiseniae TaxID=762947 RepID=A0ABS4RE58_9BACI|nr:RluA family pseudouridine synthase [Cytobacillus eiseniae]MBP2241190.1 23S rRNA pseudouridine1911/1915/1917 synthase [Cytobacillus eiseniae]